MAARNPEGAKRAVHLNAQLIGAELAALGINVDCAPVCDVPAADADPIIGDRAFATDPETVAVLVRCFCAGLSAAGVLPVIKHIPGHGRAEVDSHKALPRVTAAGGDLAQHDFAPFAALSDIKAPVPWAMTAHVIYTAHDAQAPATLSGRVIADVIRGTIGFSGAMVATYRLPLASGEMAVSVEVFHQGSSPGFGQFSNDPLKLDGFTTSNLRIGYESSEDWTATLWVNNITDEFYYKGVAGAGSNIAAHHFGFSEPRRIGFDIGWKF